MSQPYELEMKAALMAVRRAAVLCRAVQAEMAPDAMQKQDRSPVTVADFGSQALVCKAIRDAFAHDPIIAEEGSSILRDRQNASLLAQVAGHVARIERGSNSDDVCRWIDFGGATSYTDHFWTLDPIDGTKGFLRHDQYAIALALIVEGKPTVAALACPNLPLVPETDASTPGVVFTAVAGHGAFIAPLDDESSDPVPIHVSTTGKTSAARFCESFESGHSSHGDSQTIASLLNITTKPLRMDSQAKYAVVARGQADIYLRLPTSHDYLENIWDHAAGVLVIEEAGGKVTDLSGRALDFTHGAKLAANRGVVVSNGLLHDHILAALITAYVK